MLLAIGFGIISFFGLLYLFRDSQKKYYYSGIGAVVLAIIFKILLSVIGFFIIGVLILVPAYYVYKINNKIKKENISLKDLWLKIIK